jgi:putative heme-binding domain-containing protein
VWILSRIDAAAARRSVRRAMASAEPSVRQVAARSAGLCRNAEAVGELMVALTDKVPAVVREAALSLGRIGDPKVLPALLAAMRGGRDRFLEHSILYAMIQIHDSAGTRRGLADADSAVRRAALIAMDQMDGGKLSPMDVLPMLDPADPAARQAALWVLSHHAEWGGEVLDFFRTELARIDEKQAEALKLELTAFCRDEKIQRLVAETLRDEKTPTATRLLLLESIAEAPLDLLPPEWAEPLAKGLRDSDDRMARQALIAIRTGALAPRKEKVHHVDRSDFVEPLLELARASNRPAEVRAGALAVAAPFIEHLEESLFEFAVSCLQKEKVALLRSTAADALGHCRLDDAQLRELASHIADAGPMEVPKLVPAFANSKSGEVGRALVEALVSLHGVNGLRPETLVPVLAGYPGEVRRQAEALLSRLSADKEKQKAHLAELQPVLSGGSVAAGRELFFGNKAACATCHTVQNHGGRVGPDLSNIGAIRSGTDMLESIAFPSASFVRGYEPYIVKTKDGEVLDGIIARETADAIYLYNVQRIETRIARANIADVQPSAVSLMPEGFDSQLSRQELADVMAFLQSLK